MASNLLAMASNLRAMASNIIANMNACASFQAQCWSMGTLFRHAGHSGRLTLALMIFSVQRFWLMCSCRVVTYSCAPKGSELMSRSAIGRRQCRRLFGSTVQKTMLMQYKSHTAIGTFYTSGARLSTPRKPVFLVNQNPVQRNTMLDHQPFFFISIALATSSSKAAACSSDDKENRLSRPRVLAHPLLVVMCDKKRSR